MRLTSILLFSLSAAVPIPALAAEGDIARQLDAVFVPWASHRTPGCTVGVSLAGRPPVIRAYGMADLGNGIPNRATTRFEAGSVSKQFVAAAILMLVEQGDVSLADDVRKYLPEMPDLGEKITIDHLLNHTGGIRDWGFAMEVAGWPRTTRAYTNGDVLAFVSQQKHLNHAPGTDYSYTNTGYVLLAIILERVTGKSLADFTRTRIFEPLEMRATGWRTDFRHVERDRAIAYIATPEGDVERMPFENVYGDAGLLTTVGDLLIWNDALTAGKLGSFVGKAMEENARLEDGRVLTYGRGLNIPIAAIPEISHGGAIGGYRAWLARFPSRNLSVALLCNAGESLGVGRGGKLGRAVADAMLAPAPEQVETQFISAVAPYAGLFVSGKTGLPLVLVNDGKGLALDDGTLLTSRAPGRFGLRGGEIGFENANSFRWYDPDGTIDTYSRHVPNFAPDDRDALLGVYASDELGVRYRVESRSDGLRLQMLDRPDHFFDIEPVYRDGWVFDTRLGRRTGIVRFRRDELSAARSLSIGWNARVRSIEFHRVSDQTLSTKPGYAQ